MVRRLKCTVCERNLNKLTRVLCTVCLKWVHLKCSGLLSNELEEKKATFVGGCCVSQPDITSKVPDMSDSDEESAGKDRIDAVLASLVELKASNREIINSQAELKKSVEFCAERFDSLLEVTNRHGKDIEVVKGDVTSLDAQIKELKEENRNLKKAILDQHIYSRKNNMEINGVPEDVKEVLPEAFKRFCGRIGVTIQVEDIDNIHRVPSKNKSMPRPIVVKMRTHIAKHRVLSSLYQRIKDGEKVTLRLWGVESDNLVFVQHHLPPEKKFLGKKIRDLGKKFIQKTKSFENGDWVAVLRDGSSVTIRSEEDLSKLKATLGLASL